MLLSLWVTVRDCRGVAAGAPFIAARPRGTFADTWRTLVMRPRCDRDAAAMRPRCIRAHSLCSRRYSRDTGVLRRAVPRGPVSILALAHDTLVMQE